MQGKLHEDLEHHEGQLFASLYAARRSFETTYLGAKRDQPELPENLDTVRFLSHAPLTCSHFRPQVCVACCSMDMCHIPRSDLFFTSCDIKLKLFHLHASGKEATAFS